MIHPDVEQLDSAGIAKIQRKHLEGLGARLAKVPEWVEHFRKAGMKPVSYTHLDVYKRQA